MQNSFILVIFGATGDLTAHKLIPNLFSLFQKGLLPKEFVIIGFARRAITSAQFSDLFTDLAKEVEWEEFCTHLQYQQGEFEDKMAYELLAKQVHEYNKKFEMIASHIFYLATPPSYYETILDNLYECKEELSQTASEINNKLARLVIEKPFGKNLETAQMLDKKLSDYFTEWQVFRVDHYLGKETVQNMLVFRFANGLFEPVWNNQYIDHVQITFAEKKGIDGRGKFYDGVGELRDVAQNHLMQLLTTVTMGMPQSFSKEGVRDARAAAMKALNSISGKEVPMQVVRGQYVGYLDEKDIAQDSTTETFVAMKAFINFPRFLGVPFYIRAGKGLVQDEVTISLVFKQICHILFKEVGCPEEGNVLTFRIQPNEGISLKMIAKTPGTTLGLQTVDMHLSYAEQFKNKKTASAYEKILLDILAGDQMLFSRSDELESSWKFITHILKGWETEDAELFTYKLGTWGPKAAHDLIEKDGRKWI